MNITVIYGNMRHGSTWHLTQLLLDELRKRTGTSVTEFSLPRDMPHFCTGCGACFTSGETDCPHRASVAPIDEALIGADIIILASPVYVFNVSGQMKALLDHFAYRWIVHRAHPTMFRKLGVAVTTTAGAGQNKVAGLLKTSLSFWGVRRLYALTGAISAVNWEGVPAKKKARLVKRAAALAKRLVRDAARVDKLPVRPHSRLFFAVTAFMHRKGIAAGTPDLAHWEALGWENGQKPWKKQR